jgi:hypothetical protein
MEPIKANWCCGEDEFLLRIGELEALDDQTDAGVIDLRYRLSQGVQRGSLSYSPVKIREVMACIRLGLIGAGMDRGKAELKAKNAIIDGDIGELNLLAFTIISNSLKGKEHDVVGEPEAAENPPE